MRFCIHRKSLVGLLCTFAVACLVLLFFRSEVDISRRQMRVSRQRHRHGGVVGPDDARLISGQQNWTGRSIDNESYALLIRGQLDALDPRVLRHIRYHLTPPATTNYYGPNVANRWDFSQAGQSSLVDELLNGRKNGFYVECGAANGEYYSNSLFFEIHRKWKGILIEANPHYYRSLPGKNRNAYGLQACLSIAPRPSMMKMRIAGESGGLVETMHRFQKKVEEVVNGYDLDVICYPLNSIMQAIGRLIFSVWIFGLFNARKLTMKV